MPPIVSDALPISLALQFNLEVVDALIASVLALIYPNMCLDANTELLLKSISTTTADQSNSNDFFKLFSRPNSPRLPSPPTRDNDASLSHSEQATANLFLLRIYKIRKLTGSWPESVNFSNLCIESAHFPYFLKLDAIFPVYKGDYHLESNYRPVFITSCIGKLLERNICWNMSAYLDSNPNLGLSTLSFENPGFGRQRDDRRFRPP
ncbi:hypothetical protein Ciccas_004185 [Cichlidogyrus casuarinus]|uniref:Uncharacterized protein n=1 Tax=Cichlidogyrus casuarinus TaxID=1844966 RepID=A0ABD2QC69_9PLAT